MTLLDPTPLSLRHALYIGGLQCVGAAALDAGLLFGLHVLIFSAKEPVKIWLFPTTVAGDLFVSLLLTSTLTFVIAGAMVWGDVLLGARGPLRLAPLALEPVARLARGGGLVGWALTVSSVFDADAWARAVDSTAAVSAGDGGAASAAAAKTRRTWVHAVGANAARGAAWGVALSVVVWPVAVGICAGLYGSELPNYPQAPTIFAVFGAVIGAIITPLVATLALATAGRAAAAHATQAAADATDAAASVQEGRNPLRP
jgi:hypothetical protein